MVTPDLPLLQCRVMAQGEGTPGPLRPPLSSPRPERCKSGWWVCPFCSWASGLLTFRPAAEPTHSWPLFGSALPLSCFPACERTRSHQAMAERRPVLLRSLLFIGSQPWAVDNPNCPSSSPRSSRPSQPASASGPIPAARHDQPHPHPICSNIPPLDSLLQGWLSFLPCGHLGRQGGSNGGNGNGGSHTVWTRALLPWLTHPRGKTLFWRRLLGSGIGLACRGARAPAVRTPFRR